jgi:predicted DNA-binding WGR domain protein
MSKPRRFELSNAASNKFWEIEQSASGYTVRWGKLGTTGQSKTKSSKKAAAEVAALITEKVGKGYREVKRGKAKPATPPTPSRAERGRQRLIDANAKGSREQQRRRALMAKREAASGRKPPQHDTKLDLAAIKKAAAKAKNDRQRIASAFAGLRKLGYVTATRGLGIDAKDAWEYIDDHADNISAAELASGKYKCAFWTGDEDDAFDDKHNLHSPIFVLHRGDLALIRKALQAAGIKTSGSHIQPSRKVAAGDKPVKASSIGIGDVIDVPFRGRNARTKVIAANPYGDDEDQVRFNLELPGGSFIAQAFYLDANVKLVKKGTGVLEED